VGLAPFYRCGMAVGEVAASELRDGEKCYRYGSHYGEQGSRGGRVKEGYSRWGRPLEHLHGAEVGGGSTRCSGARGGGCA
jgi:hypothetical protein